MNITQTKKIAVIGAGTMGPGLAQVFAMEGFEVSVCDTNAQALTAAQSVLAKGLETFVERSLLSDLDAAKAVGRVTYTPSLQQAAADADVMIEAIVEKKDAKESLFAALDTVCPQHTVFLSNTSYLNIYDLVPAHRLPTTVIAHWFAPPHIVPLVEVVRGSQTSDATLDFTVSLLKSVGKTPAVMDRFVPGFCVNRILRILGREIFFLLDNGYMSAEELDIAVKASIIPRAMVLGLVQRYDFTGLDLSADNLRNTDYLEPPIDNAPSSLLERVARGDLGVKTGKGFYDYAGRSLEDVLASRDRALLDAFETTKKFVSQRV